PLPTLWSHLKRRCALFSVFIMSLPSCCGQHPVCVLARTIWRYGVPCLRCFSFNPDRNYVNNGVRARNPFIM
ncbi:MAG TPA: hypothetical protein PL073_12020, partial [Spirochaetota bacterium]|nr:hypothetical protein [Spirochaetota bacterium]